MKKLSVLAVSAAWSLAAFSINLTDGVLTLTGGTMSELTEELAAITGGQVTKIVKSGTGSLYLDADLSAYRGSWDIQNGKVIIRIQEGALGSYGDGTDEVLVSSASAQLQFPGGAYDKLPITIDKPVRFSASSKNTNDTGSMLCIVNHTSANTFKRKVTVEGADFGFFGGGGFTCEGGFDAPNATIVNQGANYYLNIRNVPCNVKCFYLTYHNVSFEVPGNKLKKFDCSSSGAGLVVKCDNPFAEDGIPELFGSASTNSRTFYLNGFTAKIGNINVTNAVGFSVANLDTYKNLTGNLTISNAADCVLSGTWNAPLNLTKEGAGKLTLKTLSQAGSLTARQGTVVLPEAMTWATCTGLNLDGGRVEVNGLNSLPAVPVTVTDGTSVDVLRLIDDFDYSFSSLTVGGETADYGLYGGAAAEVSDEYKCSWLDAACTGRLAVDNDLVLTQAGNFSELVTGDTLAHVLDNTYTRIVVKGNLTLDMELPSYRGGWRIENGVTKVSNALGLGVYGNGAKVVISSSGVRLYVCGGEIDKPIHFMAAYSSGDGQLYMTSTTTTFKRKITIEDSFRIFFGGTGTIYCDGGLVHKKGTITDAGASGTWYVRNVPVQINAVELTWQPLRLQVAGNAIKKVSISGGGRLILEADDALGGWRTDLVSAQADRLDSSYVQLNGHDAAIGDLNFTYAVPIHAGSGGATLSLSNDTDRVFKAASGSYITDGALSIVKEGAGKLTLSGKCQSTGSLEIRAGTFAFAPGTTWDNCPSIAVNGGRLETADAQNLPLGQSMSVAAGLTDAIVIPAGVTNQISALAVGGEDVGIGSFGGAASDAATKLACFDATAPGCLFVHSALMIDVVGSRSLTAQEKADLRNNVYTLVQKKGGELVLDDSLDGYEGQWDFISGKVTVKTHDHAFGSDTDDPNRAIQFNYGLGACLYMQEGTVNRPVVSFGTASQDNANVWFVSTHASTSNVFAEAVMMRNSASMIFYSSSKIVTMKRFACTGTVRIQTASPTWHIYGPIDVDGLSAPWTSFRFYASGNRIGKFTIDAGSSANVLCDGCFTPDTSIVMTHGSQTTATQKINLNGHDLVCAALKPDVGSLSYIHAAHIDRPDANLPVLLDFSVPSGTNTFPRAGVTMTGMFSVAKRGAGALAITNRVFTGKSLTVSDGKLIYRGDAPATWSLTNLTASATATFALDAGKVLRTKEFWLDGVRLDPGVYAGADCPVAKKTVLPCFDAGCAGYVYVRGGGATLIVR